MALSPSLASTFAVFQPQRFAVLLLVITALAACDLQGGMLQMVGAMNPNANAWKMQCTKSIVTENQCFLSYSFYYVDTYGHYDVASLSLVGNSLMVTGHLDPRSHNVIRFGSFDSYYFEKDSSYESDVLKLTDEMKQQMSQTDVAFLRIYPWPSGIQEVKIPLSGIMPHQHSNTATMVSDHGVNSLKINGFIS